MTDLNKRLTVYRGDGPKILFKEMPDGSYAEVVLTMNYGDFLAESPLATVNLEKLPQELDYDENDNLVQIKIIDEPNDKIYSRNMEYDENDNLINVSEWIITDL